MPQHYGYLTVEQNNGDDKRKKNAWRAGEGENEYAPSPEQAQQQHKEPHHENNNTPITYLKPTKELKNMHLLKHSFHLISAPLLNIDNLSLLS